MGLLSSLFREEVSKSKDFRMKVETEFDVGYSTGFLCFDVKNGSVIHVKTETQDFKYYSLGVTDGSMVTCIGRTGCGKTTFIAQAAANIVRPFKTSCVFEDNIEAGLTSIRRELLSGFTPTELQDRYICRNTGITIENFYERIKMIHDIKNSNRKSYEYDTGLCDTMGQRIFKLEPTVVILDSLAMIMSDKYTEESEMSGNMATTSTARVLSDLFKRIIPMLKSSNIILFVVNHINTVININPMAKKKSQNAYLKTDETVTGGQRPLYVSNNIIRFDDSSKLKIGEGFDIYGQYVDVSLVKSRSGKPGGVATMVLDYDIGFDAELSLFLMLKDKNKVKGAGAFLYLGDRDDMKFSQKKFKTKLLENPEFQQLFMSEAIACIKEELDGKFDEQEAEMKSLNLNDKILGMLQTSVA